MSSYSDDGGILNALIATPPQSEVMGRTLEAMHAWYDNNNKPGKPSPKDRSSWMGPDTMRSALEGVVANMCPQNKLSKEQPDLEWTCGTEKLRLYQEKGI